MTASPTGFAARQRSCGPGRFEDGAEGKLHQQLRPAWGPAPRRRGGVCYSLVPSSGGGALVPDELPEGLKIEPASDENQTDVEYDEPNKVVRIPLSALDGGRRTKLVMFTCNKCGGRTARMVNPLAWEKGAVFGQCQHCDVWHTLAANNPKIIEEVRYDDPEGQRLRREELLKAALADAGDAGSGDSMDSVATATELDGNGGGGARGQ